MELGRADRPIAHADLSDPFPFAPTSGTVSLTQARELANPATAGDGLLIENRTNDLEVHDGIVIMAMALSPTSRSMRRSERADMS
jgi:hypothetical protein